MSKVAMTKVVSRDGTGIAFEVAGDGPPVILVDGPLCHRAAGPAAALARRLADRFTVFTYDRRGRGDSDDIAPYAVEREVEDLAALVRQAGGAAGVHGFSSGAVLALEAASRGVPISRLAGYEPPFIVDDWRTPVPGTFLARLTELIGTGRRDAAVELFLARAAGLPAAGVGQLRRVPAWPAMEALAHTLAYDSMIMAGTQSGYPLPATRWCSVRIPALVLHGEDSDTDAHSAAGALADLLPHARRRAVPGRHHQVSAAALAPVLGEFFTR